MTKVKNDLSTFTLFVLPTVVILGQWLSLGPIRASWLISACCAFFVLWNLKRFFENRVLFLSVVFFCAYPLVSFFFGKAKSFNISLYISLMTGVVYMVFVILLRPKQFLIFSSGALFSCLLFAGWGIYEALTGHYLLFNHQLLTVRMNWVNGHYPGVAFANTNDLAQYIMMLFPVVSISLLRKHKVTFTAVALVIFLVVLHTGSKLALLSYIALFVGICVFECLLLVRALIKRKSQRSFLLLHSWLRYDGVKLAMVCMTILLLVGVVALSAQVQFSSSVLMEPSAEVTTAPIVEETTVPPAEATTEPSAEATTEPSAEATTVLPTELLEESTDWKPVFKEDPFAMDVEGDYYVARLSIYINVLKMAIAHPFGGFGSAYVADDYPPHNFYLFLLCDYGWIPALLFAVVLIHMAITFLKRALCARDKYAPILLLMSLCLFPVLSCVSSTNEQRKIIWLSLGILFRYYLLYLREQKEKKNAKTEREDGETPKILWVTENLSYRCGANVNIVLTLLQRTRDCGNRFVLTREDSARPIDPQKAERFAEVFTFPCDEAGYLGRFQEKYQWRCLSASKKLFSLITHPKAAVYMVDAKWFGFSISKRKLQLALECLCAEKNFDVIIGVSAPYYIAQAVSNAQVECSKVVFQLDPYTYNYTLPGKLSRVRCVIEADVLRNVDRLFAVSFVSDEIADRKISKETAKITAFELPGIRAELPQCEYLVGRQPDGLVHFMFVGQFYEQIRNPKFLFELFTKLPDNYVLDIVGGGTPRLVEAYQEKLGNRLVCHGWVSSEEALQKVNEADVLINLNNSIANQMASKLFEYISTGKPIMNICKLDNCLSLKYTSSYGNCLDLIENQGVDVAVNSVVEFVAAHKGTVIDRKEVLQRFAKNTDAYVAEQLNRLLADCVSMQQ